MVGGAATRSSRPFRLGQTQRQCVRMSRTRRDVLGMGAVASLAALAGCGGSRTAQVSTDTEYPALGNYPVGPDEVIFGMTVPKSGTYVSEGEAQLRGHDLAVDHLNSGGGGVDLWDELSGDGVLGRTVTTVEGDTATDPTHARNEAARLISEGAIMLSGGSSSRVAVAVQQLCQQEHVPFMAGVAHENRVTGADCARYGFREMPNTAMTSRALAVSLEAELGSGQTVYQLYADYSWGREQSESLDRALTRDRKSVV